MDKKEIALGADHGGFEMKEKLKNYLIKKGYSVEDLNEKYDVNDDYPDIAKKAGKEVLKNKKTGVLICGTGIGMCIAANKIKGIFAALAYSKYASEMARAHNNANVLCLGGRKMSFWKIKGVVKKFLKTPFSGEERHIRRIRKIETIK